MDLLTISLIIVGIVVVFAVLYNGSKPEKVQSVAVAPYKVEAPVAQTVAVVETVEIKQVAEEKPAKKPRTPKVGEKAAATAKAADKKAVAKKPAAKKEAAKKAPAKAKKTTVTK